MTTAKPRSTFRFLDFELDVRACELRHRGRRVRLERRPMDLLILMVERPGELITRGEIVERLWRQDVFIEVDTAVNTLVRKIRQALHDSPDAPAFIETVPGRGYRFIAPVEIVAPPAPPPASVEGTGQTPTAGASRSAAKRGTNAIVLLALLLAAAGAAWGWRSTRPGPVHVRVGVLPFDTVGIDPGRESLADALHDETITALGQIDPEHIAIVPRRSMRGYRQTTRSPAQIAQELGGLDYVVDSSIHAENGRIRVTSSLIRVRDQVVIWTRAYDDEPRSALDFQRDLGVTIAGQIRRTLAPERLEALARRHTGNSEAFRLYLRGLHAWHQLNPPQSTQLAIKFYTLATQTDPGYALAWAGLALAHAGAPINADVDPRLIGPEARRTAARAVTADARLAEAQTAMGAVHFWFDWDWTNAEAMFRQAVAADPNYAFGRRMLGILLSHQALHDEASDHMRGLLTLEPDYEMNWALRAQVAFNAHEYASAEEFATMATKFKPNFWIADYQLAMASEQRGKRDLALRTLDKHLTAAVANSKLSALRGYILGTMGRHAEAREVLTGFDAASRNRYVPPYARALVHAGLGERTAALDWLEQATDARDVHVIALATDPKWDSFRDDTRFIDLLKRCGFSKRRT